jgi:uncharacterized protein (DUF2062 family)
MDEPGDFKMAAGCPKIVRRINHLRFGFWRRRGGNIIFRMFATTGKRFRETDDAASSGVAMGELSLKRPTSTSHLIVQSSGQK